MSMSCPRQLCFVKGIAICCWIRPTEIYYPTERAEEHGYVCRSFSQYLSELLTYGHIAPYSVLNGIFNIFFVHCFKVLCCFPYFKGKWN